MSAIPNLIIGGGLAGSAMAIRLARTGQPALLIEKISQPHDKICGEFISIEAQRDLADLGVDLIALGAAPIRKLRLIVGKRIAEAALPFTGLSLSRRVLDEALLQIAGQASEVRRGVAASHLSFELDARAKLSDGTEVTAERVFLATGKHTMRGWPRDSPPAAASLGFKMHFRLSAEAATALEDHTELYLFPGGYAGLEPIEQDKANLCLVIPPAYFTSCGGSWRDLLAALAAQSPLLGERLKGAEPCWNAPLAIAAIPYGFLRQADAAPSAFYPLGDQMAVIPSFCGDGMAMALHTAALALPFTLQGDAAGYRQCAHDTFRPQMRRAGRLAALIAHPTGQAALKHLLAAWPGSLAPLVWRTRLPQARSAPSSSGRGAGGARLG